MDGKMNEFLTYVFSVTCYIHKGDVPSAILILLMEMGFQTHKEGFGYLRKAIYLRYHNQDLRMSSIAVEIVKMTGDTVSSKQIDQSICEVIEGAWDNRDDETWGLLFDDSLGKPSNKVFVSRLACVMELWNNCGGGV